MIPRENPTLKNLGCWWKYSWHIFFQQTIIFFYKSAQFFRCQVKSQTDQTQTGHILDTDISQTDISQTGQFLDTDIIIFRLENNFLIKLFLQWGRLGLHNGGRALRLEQARGPSAVAREALSPLAFSTPLCKPYLPH